MSPPAGHVRSLLRDIWADAVGGAEVSDDVDLSAHDPDGTVAERVARWLRVLLRADVPVDVVVARSTVDRMARWAAEQSLVPLPPAERAIVGERAWWPVSLAQELRLTGVRRPAEPYQKMRLDFAGVLEVDVLRRAVADVLRRNEALRLEFSEHEGTWWQRVRSTGDVGSVFEARIAPAAGAGRFSSYGDPEPGQMIQVRYVEVGPDRSYLFLAVDHLASDGRTMQLLADELLGLYSARLAGAVPAPPKRAPGPGELAVRERVRMTSAEGRRAIEEIAHRLAGASPYGFIDIPVVEKPSPARGRTVVAEVVIPQATRSAWRSAGAGTDMMIVSGLLAVVLGQETGKATIPFLSHFENRNSPELADVFGWMSNMIVVPVRSGLCGELGDTVKAARRAWFDAIRTGWFPGLVVRQSLLGMTAPRRRLPTVEFIGVGRQGEVSIDGVPTIEVPNTRDFPEYADFGPRGRIQIRVIVGEEHTSVQVAFELNYFLPGVMERILAGLARLIELGAAAIHLTGAQLADVMNSVDGGFSFVVPVDE
jgi:hypothetical protein